MQIASSIGLDVPDDPLLDSYFSLTAVINCFPVRGCFDTQVIFIRLYVAGIPIQRVGIWQVAATSIIW